MEQLVFYHESKESRLEKEVLKLQAQCEKIRKGQFARIAELTKMYTETKNELESLKEALCRTQRR